MTAVPAAAPSGRLPFTTVVGDIAAVTGRNLTKLLRSPATIVIFTIQPVMFVLLFNYVFGGAISGLPPGVDYIDYLLPGIFAQTAIFGSTGTGILLNEDLQKGIVDRFRSLPMARSAVLAGRTAADAVRQAFTVVLMIVVGVLIGFRFQNGVLAALGAVALTIALGFTFSWISANIGLRAPSAEVVQTAGFIWVFPLVFASSAFVPTQTMPDWLHAFADNQPVSVVIDAIRGLILGQDAATALGMGDISTTVWRALAWLSVIFAVAATLAVKGYRKAS